MPAGHEFTVGTTPITVFQRPGCGLAGAAGRLVAALLGVAVLSGCGAAPCFSAIRTIKRRLRLRGLTRLEEEPRPPPLTRFLGSAGGAAALVAAEGSGRET